MNKLVATAITFVVLFAWLCSCNKEYSFEQASGSLKDSLGNCNPAEIFGTYQKGLSLAADSFFVNVEVDITKTGAYHISTDVVNGFSFAATGTVDKTGLQKIRLKASGTPLADTLSIFNCSFDTSNCSFSIPVKTYSPAPPVIPKDSMELNTWYFNDSTDGSFHNGIIDVSSTWFNNSNNQNLLNLVGWPGTQQSSNKDTLFIVKIYFPQPQIDTGYYPITAGNSLGYANNTILTGIANQSYFYYYNSDSYISTDFIFSIDSYNATDRIVSGSFKGASQRRKEYSDYVGTLHKIKGRFYFKLQ